MRADKSIRRKRCAIRPQLMESNAGIFGLSVRLDAVAVAPVDAQDDSPRWVQIAMEGNYPGYRNGEQPFSLTRDVFNQLVNNFHANPSYKAGTDGVGSADVIPWDFHHASELWPADGSIPMTGAPAQGWTRELEVRTSPEGRAELWGLTRFLELARGYVRNGQYQWASVSVSFNTIDPASAKNVGAVLTSVALTNSPIVQGMQKLVASRQQMRQQINAGHGLMLMDMACDAEEAIERLRELFGLPATAGLPELTGEIAKLKQWALQGGAPVGVEIEDIIGAMRKLFNLPALSSSDEVLAEADKLISRMVQEQAGQIAPAPALPPEGAATAAAAKVRERKLDMELLKVLAGRLGVREADAAIEAAIVELTGMRDSIQKLVGAESDSTPVLLDAVEKSISARAKLTALLKAMGVSDADAAVNRIAELMQQAKELAGVMPELSSLRSRIQKSEEAAAELDVDSVIASRGYGPEIRDALLLLRTSNAEKFAASYPKQQAGDDKLLASVVVTPKLQGSLQSKVSVKAGQPNVINLAIYPGINSTERAMACIRATVNGSDSWSHEDVFVAACNLKKQPNVVDQT